jgi:hypothetical protein
VAAREGSRGNRKLELTGRHTAWSLAFLNDMPLAKAVSGRRHTTLSGPARAGREQLQV